MVGAIYELTNLLLVRGGHTQNGSQACLGHCEVPVVFLAFSEINKSEWDHPVFYRLRIGIKREYFEFYRVELVKGNGCFRVGIQILV